MNKTKVIILIILLFISIGVVSYISNPSENENNTSSLNEEYNKNDLKESTIKNIAFKPQKLYYKDGNSYLSVDIINNNDTAINLGSFKIIVKKGNDILGTYNSIIPQNIRSKEKTNITVGIDQNFLEADSLDYNLDELKFIDDNNLDE